MSLVSRGNNVWWISAPYKYTLYYGYYWIHIPSIKGFVPEFGNKITNTNYDSSPKCPITQTGCMTVSRGLRCSQSRELLTSNIIERPNGAWILCGIACLWRTVIPRRTDVCLIVLHYRLLSAVAEVPGRTLQAWPLACLIVIGTVAAACRCGWAYFAIIADRTSVTKSSNDLLVHVCKKLETSGQ